jgi:hypothetical protein
MTQPQHPHPSIGHHSQGTVLLHHKETSSNTKWSACLVCDQPYHEPDVVKLAATAGEAKEIRARLLRLQRHIEAMALERHQVAKKEKEKTQTPKRLIVSESSHPAQAHS